VNPIEDIDVAELMPGAWRFKEKNINATFKGHIQPNDGEQIAAFVKVLTPREIFIESVCALLGRAAGLPIPKPYLVIMASDALVDGADINVPLFGLEDASQPSFRHLVTIDEDTTDETILNAILIQLKKWNKLNGTILFDELVLNDDRNIGNLLYDGSAEFTLIDHGRALRDPSSASQITSPNMMAGIVSGEELLSRKRRQKHIETECLSHYSGRKYDLLASKTKASGYNVKEDDIEFVIQILSDRINHISQLLSQQLGLSTKQTALNL